MDYDLEKIHWHRSPGAGVIDAQTEKICPHAHWVSEQDNILYLADLGCDRIYRYELKDGLPEKELEALVLPTGEGPRQLLPEKESGKLRYLGEWATGNWPRHLLQIPGTDLIVNACNKEGTLVIFAWNGKELIRKDEIILPGASCADYLSGK